MKAPSSIQCGATKCITPRYKIAPVWGYEVHPLFGLGNTIKNNDNALESRKTFESFSSPPKWSFFSSWKHRTINTRCDTGEENLHFQVFLKKIRGP